jgi:tellurite methyltransferase
MSGVNREGHSASDAGHRSNGAPRAPEPSVTEMLELLPRGLALDIAAGSGRHSLLLARAGFKVVAIDYDEAALRALQTFARAERLPIWALAADLSVFPLPRAHFDAILNVNFLDRALVPRLIGALRPGGALLFDTFLIDQAATGHPRNPEFMLRHYELREMLDAEMHPEQMHPEQMKPEMDLVRYREGIVAYPDGKRAWRATALAIHRGA